RRPTYAQLAADLGLTASTVTNELAAARREFRRIVLAVLREQCATDEEDVAEARALTGAAHDLSVRARSTPRPAQRADDHRVKGDRVNDDRVGDERAGDDRADDDSEALRSAVDAGPRRHGDRVSRARHGARSRGRTEGPRTRRRGSRDDRRK